MSAGQTDGERESQLSAMFDGELPAGECELVARRLAKDENLRRSWDNYSLIGAVMRSEPLARRHLAPQVAAVVQAERSAATSERPEESGLAAGQSVRQRSSVLRWAGGFGVAAAVGAVAIFIGGQPQNETVVADAAQNPANRPAQVAGEVVEEVVIPAASSEGDAADSRGCCLHRHCAGATRQFRGRPQCRRGADVATQHLVDADHECADCRGASDGAPGGAGRRDR